MSSPNGVKQNRSTDTTRCYPVPMFINQSRTFCVDTLIKATEASGWHRKGSHTFTLWCAFPHLAREPLSCPQSLQTTTKATESTNVRQRGRNSRWIRLVVSSGKKPRVSENWSVRRMCASSATTVCVVSALEGVLYSANPTHTEHCAIVTACSWLLTDDTSRRVVFAG